MGFLRPDADVSDGGWVTDVGGTSLFAVVNESAFNDANYVHSSANPSADAFEIALGDPGGSIAEPFVVRSRFKREGVGAVNLTVTLKQGATPIASWTYSDIANAFTTLTETLTTPQFAAITDPTDLRLAFSASVAPTTAVWDPAHAKAGLIFSNGNLTIASPQGSFDEMGVRATRSASSGKKYYECVFNIYRADFDGVGFVDSFMSDWTTAGGIGTSNTPNSVGWFGSGAVVGTGSGSTVTTIQTYGVNDVLGLAVNLGTKKWWGKNITQGGGWNNDILANQDPGNDIGGLDLDPWSVGHVGPWFPAVALLQYVETNPEEQLTGNFGASAYAGTPPVGYGNW